MSSRILLVVLDATDKTQIDRWIGSGDLPNLRQLRDRGAYGSLQSVARFLNGSTWATFVSGTWPSDHGNNHFLMWRPEQMKVHRPTADWVDFDPFWYPLAKRGRSVVAIDVPFSGMALQPTEAVEIRDWGSHYKVNSPSSTPPELYKTVARRYGKHALGPDKSGLKNMGQILSMRKELLGAVSSQLDAARHVMRTYPWELFILSLGAPHRGGHHFCGPGGLRETSLTTESDTLANSLRDVYRACDDAIGKLIEAAGGDTNVLVISLHGMRENSSKAYLLPAMLESIMSGGRSAVNGRPSLLKRLRERVPNEWRSAVKTRLPATVQDWLSAYWQGQTAYDWAETRAFCPPPDNEGYIRINVQGRESQGLVPPGQPYDELCDHIRTGLLTFVDADSKQPLIEAVSAPDQLFPDGERIFLLPDLIVRWSDAPARKVRAAFSAEYGTIPWPTPDRIPDGKAGHHNGNGWIMAGGPAVRPGSTIEDAHAIDMAPTLFRLFDEPVPKHFRGKLITIPGLTSP